MTDEDFTDEDDVMSVGDWNTNADLFVDVAKLGYLRKEWSTWDATYGEGVFWDLWRPDTLIGTDLDPVKTDKLVGPVDFTASPWDDASFDCVVFDPPYKLNGQPDEKIDARYGVNQRANREHRLGLIEAGTTECARVLGNGYLLAKGMDQVEGGKTRWQTDIITRAAEDAGLRKVDVFIFQSYRPQPKERNTKNAAGETVKVKARQVHARQVHARQVHARHNFSTLLVFKRVKKARRQQSLTV